VLTVNPSTRRRAAIDALLRRTSHPMSVPVLMAVLVLAVGTQVACVFKIPSWGNDEPAHLGYIASLARGDLPTIETDIVEDPAQYGALAPSLEGWDEEHGDIWTANHAPLFHLSLLPLWWASDGEPQQVFIAMRLVNTIGFALWVLLVGLIARELVPRRPAVPALAAVLASTPTLVLRSGFLMNDGMSSAGALLLLWMTIRMMRHDVTRARLLAAATGGVLAAGTRASGVLMVVICCVALLVVVWRRDGVRRALPAAAVVGGVPALLTGWFYVRNLHLYADLTGQDALLDKFQRSDVTGIGAIWAIPSLDEAVYATPIPILVLLVLVPVAAVARLRRGGVSWDPAWVLLLLHGAITTVQIVGFLRTGGGYHDRYLMTVMPLLATVGALAMMWAGRSRPDGAADRREWAVAAVWAGILLAWLAGALIWLERLQIFGRQDHHPVQGALPEVLVGIAVAAGLLSWATFVAHAARSAGLPDLAEHPPQDQLSAEPAL